MLGVLAGLAEVMRIVLHRTAKKSGSSGSDDEQDGESGETFINYGGSIANTKVQTDTQPQPNSQPEPNSQFEPKYTVSQLQGMVPASIQDATSKLSGDQWNNIAAAANRLTDQEFAQLKQQLTNIGWAQSLVINALSADALYKAIMTKLND